MALRSYRGVDYWDVTPELAMFMERYNPTMWVPEAKFFISGEQPECFRTAEDLYRAIDGMLKEPSAATQLWRRFSRLVKHET